MPAGTIAYALCVVITLGEKPICLPLPAEECKRTLEWYRDNGYAAECRIADQPLTKGKLQ